MTLENSNRTPEDLRMYNLPNKMPMTDMQHICNEIASAYEQLDTALECLQSALQSAWKANAGVAGSRIVLLLSKVRLTISHADLLYRQCNCQEELGG
jgi:hypothetical protein